jgi:S1-C subfamily serine protease
MRAAATRLGALRPGAPLKKALPIAAAALLILAAGAYALTSMLGSSNHSTPPPAAQASPPVYWLGMQLESTQPGQVVVATVAPGSRAEQAGLDPGDVIPAVNGKSLNATSDVSPAIQGLRRGDRVEIKVSRGSTLFTTHASLAAPPSNNP